MGRNTSHPDPLHQTAKATFRRLRELRFKVGPIDLSSFMSISVIVSQSIFHPAYFCVACYLYVYDLRFYLTQEVPSINLYLKDGGVLNGI